jgi:hypothetical protein
MTPPQVGLAEAFDLIDDRGTAKVVAGRQIRPGILFGGRMSA